MDNYKYYIFDMDGTVLDSMTKWYDQGKEAVEKVLKISIQFSSYPELKRTVKKYIAEASVEDRNDIFDEWYSEMDSYEGIKPKEYIVEFLEKLKSKGARMCIGTATKKAIAEKAIKERGLDKYFEFVATSELVNKPKTEPDLFLYCIDKFGCKPEECVVFEDMMKFCVKPKQLGFHIVGVLDPVHANEEEEFTKLADRYIHSFKELL